MKRTESAACVYLKVLLSEYYKLYSVANADDSTRFDNIFNPLSQTLAEYFQSLLQIEFRYAFPCRKRWFLRSLVSQHHLAANRLPVWRFAAVRVHWTTLHEQRFFLLCRENLISFSSFGFISHTTRILNKTSSFF